MVKVSDQRREDQTKMVAKSCSVTAWIKLLKMFNVVGVYYEKEKCVMLGESPEFYWVLAAARTGSK